jgi:hypothetical protein
MPGHLDGPDAVEATLAKALEGAPAAGRWDVVAQLASDRHLWGAWAMTLEAFPDLTESSFGRTAVDGARLRQRR